MKISNDDSFDFNVNNENNSSDIIVEKENFCSSKTICEENIKINDQKQKQTTEISEVNELVDLSNNKKLKKIRNSHSHEHSDHEDENVYCESKTDMHDDHNSTNCNSHNHSHHDHKEENSHFHLHEG